MYIKRVSAIALCAVMVGFSFPVIAADPEEEDDQAYYNNQDNSRDGDFRLEQKPEDAPPNDAVGIFEQDTCDI